MTIHQEIVKALIRKFPSAPAMTLAKRAYRENPEVWPNLERARSSVRHALGVCGRDKGTSDTSLFRKPRKAGTAFSRLPKALTHLDDWMAAKVDGPCNALILSDVHIPYHNLSAVIAALRYGEQKAVDTIILNGDMADFYSVSYWQKDPRKRRMPEELKDVNQFLCVVREMFPKARILYKLGNHEERLENYMELKAPELLGIEAFQTKQLLGLDDLGIEVVVDKRPILLGKLWVIHGHEFRHAIAAPVNPARGLYLRAGDHCIEGHFHQSSQHSEKRMGDHVVSTWSTGCLCDMRPSYAVYNKWNHGFATVEVDKGGAFYVQNLKIFDGKIY